ncbi:MAG: leucine-rich repeat protein [Bacteroides sp.]|nr:leucine-rich repeat protein [Bacillota bacterium]MCM1394278.1 leucine-rich repeat protein [[Eubacterium] siraeum]MCM1455488.1 leucine-rich repeat protein [Bacteroides sp.]
MKKATKILMIIATLIITVSVLVACNTGQHTPTHTVTFQPNGGSAVASETLTQIDAEPVTTRDGYDFAGWYDNAELSGERITFPYAVTKDITLYAKWTAKKYAVTFVTNGGSSVAQMTVSEIATEPQTTRDEFDFLGWYDNAEFNGSRITFPYAVTGIKTLYAKWEETAVSDWTQTTLADYETEADGDNVKLVKYTGSAENIILPLDANLTFADDFLGQDEPTVKAVKIPANITEPHYLWFYYCEALKEIAVEDGHTALSADHGVLFSKDGTELIAYPQARAATGYTVPSTVETIGYYAFACNKSIENLTVSEGVETLSYGAFYYMQSLKTISIPSSVTTLGNYCFYHCESLKAIAIPSATTVGTYCFSECASLESVELPSTLSSFGSRSFNGCTSLKRVVGPIYVWNASMGYERKALADVVEYVEINGGETLRRAALQNCTALKKVVIGSSVTTISDLAFDGCTALTEVELSEGLQTIGGGVFANTKITEIKIPSTVTTLNSDINGNTFNNTSIKTIHCSADLITALYPNFLLTDKATLQNLIITSGTSIPDTGGGYNGFDSLHTLVIPASVTSIDENAFRELPSLVQITNLSGVNWTPFIYNNLGEKVPSSTEIRRSASAPFEGVISQETNGFVKYTYQNEVRLLDYDRSKEIVTLDASDFAGYTSIGAAVFRNCTSITSVTVPSNIKLIGDDAFYGCTALQSLTIASGVESIGKNAFMATQNLMSVTIPQSVTSMGMQAFSNSGSGTLTISVKGYSEKPEGWHTGWYVTGKINVIYNA